MHDSIVLRRRIAESRVAQLATVDADGRPHLVPIVFVLADDTLYSAVVSCTASRLILGIRRRRTHACD
jgi:nitroimidazol reductase NimA-like FMN-containing flavoprotein (pyridoxamine 5'-phosphate oxidase superfamily)